MKLPVFILIGIITAFAVRLIFGLVQRGNDKERIENKEREEVVIHLPKAYFWVGVVCAAFSFIVFVLILLLPKGTADPGVGLMFGGFAVLGILIAMFSGLWRTQVYRSEDYFVHTSVFGVKREIRYAEIAYYKFSGSSLIVCTGRKKYRLPMEAANIEVLGTMLREHQVKMLRKI